MLKKLKASSFRPTGGHFAIVASTYNERYVAGMLSAAGKCLRAAERRCLGRCLTINSVKVR